MKYITRELLSIIAALVAAFLLLTHSTGFSRDVSSISTGGVSLIKTLQGR